MGFNLIEFIEFIFEYLEIKKYRLFLYFFEKLIILELSGWLDKVDGVIFCFGVNRYLVFFNFVY